MVTTDSLTDSNANSYLSDERMDSILRYISPCYTVPFCIQLTKTLEPTIVSLLNSNLCRLFLPLLRMLSVLAPPTTDSCTYLLRFWVNIFWLRLWVNSFRSAVEWICFLSVLWANTFSLRLFGECFGPAFEWICFRSAFWTNKLSLRLFSANVLAPPLSEYVFDPPLSEY